MFQCCCNNDTLNSTEVLDVQPASEVQLTGSKSDHDGQQVAAMDTEPDECPQPTEEVSTNVAEKIQSEPAEKTEDVTSAEEKPTTIITESTFVVALTLQDDEKLGLSLDYADQKTLLILAVRSGGAAEKWNSENPEVAMCVRSRIIEVNGVSGQAQEMLEELKKRSCLIKLRFPDNTAEVAP